MDNPFIPLASAEGKQLLSEVTPEQQVFHARLWKVFKRQQHSTFCGIATAAIVHNALLDLDPEQNTQALDEVRFHKNLLMRCRTTSFNIPQLMQSARGSQRVGSASQECSFFCFLDIASGITLDELEGILSCLGFKYLILPTNLIYLRVQRVHASDCTPTEFCQKASEALQSGLCVIVNYDCTAIKQSEVIMGHISPISAYHQTSNRFLLLDVWPQHEVELLSCIIDSSRRFGLKALCCTGGIFQSKSF